MERPSWLEKIGWISVNSTDSFSNFEHLLIKLFVKPRSQFFHKNKSKLKLIEIHFDETNRCEEAHTQCSQASQPSQWKRNSKNYSFSDFGEKLSRKPLAVAANKSFNLLNWLESPEKRMPWRALICRLTLDFGGRSNWDLSRQAGKADWVLKLSHFDMVVVPFSWYLWKIPRLHF